MTIRLRANRSSAFRDDVTREHCESNKIETQDKKKNVQGGRPNKESWT